MSIIATPGQRSEIADGTNRTAGDPYTGTVAGGIPITAGSYLAICTHSSIASGTPGIGTPDAFSLTWTPQATVVFNPVSGGLNRLSLWTSLAASEIAATTAWGVEFDTNANGCCGFLMAIPSGMIGWRQPLTNAADDVDTTGTLAVAMAAPLNANCRTLLFTGANQGTAEASFSAGSGMTEIDEASHSSPATRLAVFWSGASAFAQNPSAAPTANDTEMGAIAIELIAGGGLLIGGGLLRGGRLMRGRMMA